MKKTLSIILSILMVISVMPLYSITTFADVGGVGWPDEFLYKYENFGYNIQSDGTIVIHIYLGTDENVIIPSEIDGRAVTAVGHDAFSLCNSLTSITIPDSVTSIGDYAFCPCENLTSITIPDSITSIGHYAFAAYCNDETNWEDGVLYLGNYLLMANELISCDYTIKSGTTVIADYAFSSCKNLISVTIPDSVTSIGSNAFASCENLTNITIGDSVTSIGRTAFGNTAYDNDTTNWKDNVLYLDNYLLEVSSSISGDYVIKSGTTVIADDAFSWCEYLTSITIPDSVISIGNNTFYFCTNLTSVTMGDSITSIGDGAFYFCPSLTSITIPDGVTSIGGYAFYECGSLTSITIPDSVTNIGDEAFYGCTGIISVTIPDSVTYIGFGAFNYCERLVDVYYNGTESQWNRIEIKEYNEDLLNATIHYMPDTPSIKPGDVNGDGKISAIDARVTLQAAAGLEPLTDDLIKVLDMNNDGKVTAIDARWILQISAGLK